jgi:hypothetical protein
VFDIYEACERPATVRRNFSRQQLGAFGLKQGV